jgi:hypothetical protein
MRKAPALGLILFAGVASYANSLSGEFVFDDVDSIVGNPSIRALDPVAIFAPAPNLTVSGRPLVNLTLALNYAAGGLDVGGYHLVNVLLHLAAAAVLFLLVRDTLALPAVPDVFRGHATDIALAVGLVWVVHPLQTEVVSYVVQRGEALAALFLLLILLCLLRGASSRHASLWYAGAVGACVLGVLSKEVMAAAPVVALLYDRAFLSGSFREAFRRRAVCHVGLLSTWVLLGLLIWTTHGRGRTVGFDTAVSPLHYAAAQSMWVLHYLRLSVWPAPLVFDYGPAVAPWGRVTQAATAVTLTLLGLSVALFARRPALGFLPLGFFVALAPSSSFVPIATQIAAERRMYLPLAVVIILIVLVGVRLGSFVPVSATTRRRALFALLAAWVVPLVILTHLRNRDYRTGLVLWADTAAKVPDNARARANFGQALLKEGRVDAAATHLRTATELAPP